MKFEECFAHQLSLMSERVPLVEYLRSYQKLALVYIGVFLKQEVSNTLKFVGLLRETKSIVSYTRVTSPKFADLVTARMKLPQAINGKHFSRIDPTVIIVRIKKGEMLHDKPIKPIFGAIGDEEELVFMWGITEEVSKFGICIKDVIVDKKYVAPCDVFAYNTDVRIFMDGEDRVKIFFRAIYSNEGGNQTSS